MSGHAKAESKKSSARDIVRLIGEDKYIHASDIKMHGGKPVNKEYYVKIIDEGTCFLLNGPENGTFIIAHKYECIYADNGDSSVKYVLGSVVGSYFDNSGKPLDEKSFSRESLTIFQTMVAGINAEVGKHYYGIVNSFAFDKTLREFIKIIKTAVAEAKIIVEMGDGPSKKGASVDDCSRVYREQLRQVATCDNIKKYVKLYIATNGDIGVKECAIATAFRAEFGKIGG